VAYLIIVKCTNRPTSQANRLSLEYQVLRNVTGLHVDASFTAGMPIRIWGALIYGRNQKNYGSLKNRTLIKSCLTKQSPQIPLIVLYQCMERWVIPI
jgi:hypothetical protein